MPESRYSVEGQAFTQEVRKRAHAADIATLDLSMPPEAVDAVLAKWVAVLVLLMLVAAFSAVSSGRGSVGLAGDLAAGRTSLDGVGQARDHGRARCNPYLLRNFPDRNGISRHFQHGSAFRDCRGEGAVG